MQVDIAREYRYDLAYPYGTNGYRSDCRNYRFNEIAYIDEGYRNLGPGGWEYGGNWASYFQLASGKDIIASYADWASEPPESSVK